ncbi:MAG: hypothetical protein U0T75_00545 [Chitinophagales bacterium]
MKKLFTLLLLLPAALMAQNQCCRYDSTADYLNLGLGDMNVFVSPPLPGLKIRQGANFAELQNHKDKTGFYVSIGNDNAVSTGYDYSYNQNYENPLNFKRDFTCFTGDTLLKQLLQDGSITKEISKIKYKVPASWEIVQRTPQNVGEEYIVWTMLYQGPSGMINAAAIYPLKRDAEVAGKFQKALLSLYTDSLEKPTDKEVFTYTIDLTGTGLEEGKLSKTVPWAAKYKWDSDNLNLHRYFKKGFIESLTNLRIVDILAKDDPLDLGNPSVQMDVNESAINVCKPDFITSKCSTLLSDLTDKLGETAQVSTIQNVRVNGLDAYEAEAKVVANNKVIATGYTIALFASNRYYIIKAFASEKPEEYLAAFKKAARTFVYTAN